MSASLNVRPDPVTEDDLHGYVDGCLDPRRRSRVEAYLAVNRDEAERIDAYRAQRIGMHVLFDAPPGQELPKKLADLERRISRAASRGRWLRRSFRVAASLAALVVASGVGWWVAQYKAFDAPRLTTSWVFSTPHFLVSDHAADTAGVAADDESRLVGWLTRNAATASVAVPDLRPFGLNFVGGRVLATPAGPAVQLSYDDSGTQRLNLYISMTGGARKADITALQTTDGSLVYWSDGSLVYTLAGSVNQESLVRIARTIATGLAMRPDQAANQPNSPPDVLRTDPHAAAQGQEPRNENTFDPAPGKNAAPPNASPPAEGSQDRPPSDDPSDAKKSGATRI